MKTNIFKIVICIISSIFLIVACSRRTEHLTIPTLPVSFEEYDFSLSDIADKLNYIPLSNNEVLPRIERIRVFDSCFYIQTRNDKLFRFSLNGEYIDKLDKAGRAPDEYMGLNNFFTDSRGRIFINCKTGGKIKIYDNSLDYLGEIRYPKDVDDAEMYWFKNKIYLFPRSISQSPKYDWVVIDTAGTTLYTKENHSYGKITHFTSNHSLLLFGNDQEFYRFREIEDTIYAFTEYNHYPKFLIQRNFDDGYRMFSQEELTREIKSINELNSLVMQSGIRSIHSFYDIGNYWIVGYKDQKYKTALFDIKRNELCIINESDNLFELKNDWVGAGCIFPMGTLELKGNRYLFSVMDAYRFLEYVNSNDFKESIPKRPELKEKFQGIADTLTIEDNPVLLLLKLKSTISTK